MELANCGKELVNFILVALERVFLKVYFLRKFWLSSATMIKFADVFFHSRKILSWWR